MDQVKSMFNEVKFELLKVALIYSFLDSTMVFFISYFVVSFFKIEFIFSLLIPGIITLVFFGVTLSNRIARARLKDMEDANPQLKEMLRTAHDNRYDHNPMMDALLTEVKGKLHTASSGNLLQGKKIMTRISAAIITVFLIVVFSSFTVNLDKIDIPFDKLKFLSPKDETRQEGDITTLVFNQTDVVYGDPSVAKLGSEIVNLKVNPTLSEADFNNIKDSDGSNMREGALPQEVGISADAFNNQKVLDEAERAANYSQRIRNI